MLCFGFGLTASTKQWTPVQPERWLREDLWGLPGVNPNCWPCGNLVLGSPVTSNGVQELLYWPYLGLISSCLETGSLFCTCSIIQPWPCPEPCNTRDIQNDAVSVGVYRIGNFVSLTSSTISVNLLHQYGGSHYYRAGRGCTNAFSIAFQLCFTLHLIQIKMLQNN